MHGISHVIDKIKVLTETNVKLKVNFQEVFTVEKQIHSTYFQNICYLQDTFKEQANKTGEFESEFCWTL